MSGNKNKKLSAQEIAAMVTANSSKNTAPIKASSTIALGHGAQIIQLRAQDVKPYKDNPRTDPHPDFEGLKDSIRQPR